MLSNTVDHKVDLTTQRKVGLSSQNIAQVRVNVFVKIYTQVQTHGKKNLPRK